MYHKLCKEEGMKNSICITISVSACTESHKLEFPKGGGSLLKETTV